jgi:hypothetical protein
VECPFAFVPPKLVSLSMTSLLNIDQLYGSLQSTWDKIRADVFSHFLLFLVLLGVGTTVPAMPLLKIDPQQLMENHWFELAKETNILFLAPVAIIVLIVLYGAALRSIGRLILVFQAFVFPPPDYGPLLVKHVGRDHLATIALTLDKDDFTLDDIIQRMGELLLLYTAKRKEDVQSYQQNLGKLSKNAYIYAGNASTFLVAWILAFVLLPNSSEWKLDNQDLFWPVTVLLTGAVVWTWTRTRRTLSMLPVIQTSYISLLLRSDPDMKSDISRSNERYSQIWRRLEDLQSDEEEKQRRSSQDPSLGRFLRYYLKESRSGVEDEIRHSGNGVEKSPAPLWYPRRYRILRQDEPLRGLPFRTLYWVGYIFETSNTEFLDRAGRWLTGYFAYLYYRTHNQFTSILRRVWQFLTFYLRGGMP